MPMLICGSDGQTQEPVTVHYHGKGGKEFLGRTFTAQLMLMEKGIKYEQAGLKLDDEDWKKNVLRGSFAVPIVEVGGMKCSQTVAIAEMLGQQLDLMPIAFKGVEASLARDPQGYAMVRARQMNCDAADFVAEAFSKPKSDPENWPKRMEQWMNHFEACLSSMPFTVAGDEKYFIGDKPSFVDFHILHPVEMMDIVYGGKCFGDCKLLPKWFNRMKATKGYEGYLALKTKIGPGIDRFA